MTVCDLRSGRSELAVCMQRRRDRRFGQFVYMNETRAGRIRKQVDRARSDRICMDSFLEGRDRIGTLRRSIGQVSV